VLSPSEEAILIEEVYGPSEEVYELSLYNMGDCLNKVIRWLRKLLKELAHVPELGEQFVQQQPTLWSLRRTQSGFTPHTLSFLASMVEVRGNQVHGQPYCHRTRAQRRPRGPCIIGKPRKERLSLDCVIMDKEKVLCSQRCLHDIQVEDILILRCLSLGSPKYERRLMWIIDSLRGFMTVERTLNMQERIKCVTRISGKRVYNACYALAIGYSQNRLADLIAEIRDTGRCASHHGNTHRRREKNKITMARVIFEQYVKDFGEPMPNRETRRLKDSELVQTICLPMNVRHAEIWLTINSKLGRLGEPSIGLPYIS
jgi:hypothetical protein